MTLLCTILVLSNPSPSAANYYRIKALSLGGLVAQRLEQRTHNPLVPGSNPGGPTFSRRKLFRWKADVVLSEGLRGGARTSDVIELGDLAACVEWIVVRKAMQH
jgi:hypothetical protein